MIINELSKYIVENDDINFQKDFMEAGLAYEKGITIDDVDPDELEMGIQIEMEHTSNPVIATRIALDHLAEEGSENYYTQLKKMEEKMRNKK